MRTAGLTLDELGGSLSERSLLSFSRNLPMGSALLAEMDGLCGWSRAEQLLARLTEAVELLDWHVVCKGLRKSNWPRRPEPIPRPGVEGGGKRIGKDPIPVSEFDAWYYGGGDG